MNCESWLEPKNSRSEATKGRIFTRLTGETPPLWSRIDMRSLITRSIRRRPTRSLF